MNPTLVLVGRLSRDYLLPPSGRPLIDAPGGELLYAAGGAAVWTRNIGLVGRVGEDYPRDWLQLFEQYGLDVRGIRILPQALDLRFFRAYLDTHTFQETNPSAHFGRLGLTFPKTLLGYRPPFENRPDSLKSQPADPRPTEIPADYLEARAVHFCPLHLSSAGRLIQTFRDHHIPVLTLDLPLFKVEEEEAWRTLRPWLHGLTAFLPAEKDLRALFRGMTDQSWDMMEEVAIAGCSLVAVRRDTGGQWLYDSASRRRWEVPPYPARLADPTGSGSAFCGGFLAGLQKTQDPLQAVLYGNISASLNIEGSGPFYALDALPGLAQARLDSLSYLVRQR